MFAQDVKPSLAGVVKDASGAVLPGVTVEVASPALIEKVRGTISDGSGQYRIIDLQPGVYSVTFQLAGFSTTKREGVQLSGSGVMTVNAELAVGSLEETVTVSGETPVVDVQSGKRQAILSNDVLTSLPTVRSYSGLLVAIPSMIQSGGGNPNIQLSAGSMVVFGGRGGRGNEGRVQVDGINTGAGLNGGGVQSMRQDVNNSQEVVITTAGGLGEAEVGGPNMNFVPRNGGNTFKFYFFGTGMAGGMAGSNYTQDLKNAGLTTPATLLHLWQVEESSGGPIVKDRLWYYTTINSQGIGQTIPGMYFNLNAGNPTKFLYAPDLSHPASNVTSLPFQPQLRLTVQANAKNRFNLFWDEQPNATQTTNGSPTASPETDGTGKGGFQRIQQATWTSTQTNRLLLEAGIGTYLTSWDTHERPGNQTENIVQVVEQCASGCASNGNIPGLTYRSQLWHHDWNSQMSWRASASYATGAHAMKFGYQGAFSMDDRHQNTNTENLAYRFNNGVPNQLTELIEPLVTLSRTQYNAFYAQDSWTHERLTLQGAVRYDHSWSYYPPQQLGQTVFEPTVLAFGTTTGVIGYNDITPRLGAVYDLFGNGRTAIKFTMGKYLEAAVNGNGNYSGLLPSSRIATSVTRTWSDANHDYNPDCNLQNPLANGECGQISNLNFGKNVYSLSYDPTILQGWGVRPSDWGTYLTLQQQILPRVALTAGYTRRWLQNFTVIDNRSVSASDYTPFSVTAPLDPRLPGGGGYSIPGLYDIAPAKFGQTNNLVTYAPNYGNISSIYNGLELNVTARLLNSLSLQAGSSTGETVTDSCAVRAVLPEQTQAFATASNVPAYSPTNPYCHFAPGITTRWTALGSYTIPKVEVQLAAALQSSPGIPLQANMTVSNALASQSLGRNLGAGAGSNVTVNLLAPNAMISPRVNELDIRIGKIIRFGRHPLNVALDVYNLTNADTVLTYNFNYIPNGQWLVPTSVLTARTAKVTVNYEF
jgi:hypothetical protein